MHTVHIKQIKKAGEWRGRVQASMISVRARLVSCSLRRLACLPAQPRTPLTVVVRDKTCARDGRLAVARGRR